MDKERVTDEHTQHSSVDKCSCPLLPALGKCVFLSSEPQHLPLLPRLPLNSPLNSRVSGNLRLLIEKVREGEKVSGLEFPHICFIISKIALVAKALRDGKFVKSGDGPLSNCQCCHWPNFWRQTPLSFSLPSLSRPDTLCAQVCHLSLMLVNCQCPPVNWLWRKWTLFLDSSAM